MAPLAYRQGDQLRILIECLGGDADIGIAGDHPFGDLRRAALVHFELDGRVPGDEITYDHGQRIARLGVGSRQHQSPRRAAGKVGTGPLEVVRLAQDALGDRQHRLPRLGQPAETLAAALEDRHPEFVLEQSDLLGNPGLRGKERLGRLGNVETLALDLDDVTQLLKFHGQT